MVAVLPKLKGPSSAVGLVKAPLLVPTADPVHLYSCFWQARGKNKKRERVILQEDRRGLHCMQHQELLVQGWEITGNFEGGAWGEWVLGTERRGTQQRIMTECPLSQAAISSKLVIWRLIVKTDLQMLPGVWPPY